MKGKGCSTSSSADEETRASSTLIDPGRGSRASVGPTADVGYLGASTVLADVAKESRDSRGQAAAAEKSFASSCVGADDMARETSSDLAVFANEAGMPHDPAASVIGLGGFGAASGCKVVEPATSRKLRSGVDGAQGFSGDETRPPFVLRVLEPLSLIMVPAALSYCAATGSEQSAFLTLFAALCSIAVFFTGFEVSRPSLRQIMPTVVLGAIAAAGRIVFAPIADFKPVSAICILAGATLGRRSGFMVGALAALVSNFFFGQGAWTPWQMYAWGLIGYLAGVLAPRGAFEKTPVLLLFGFLSAMLYGLILNGWYVVGFIRPITLPSVLAAYAAGFPYDFIHGTATVFFLATLYVPWRRKLDRIKRKFDLLIR